MTKSVSLRATSETMVFREIKIEDRELIEDALERSANANCDLTFANLYCWNDSYKAEIAFIGESIVIRYCYDEKEYVYTVMARKEDCEEIFRSVEKHAKDNGEKLRYFALGAECLKYLRTMHPETGCHFHRGRSEYIYRREDLAGLKGSHFKAKRNHMNRFRASYQFTYRPLTRDDAAECLELLEIWNEEHISQGLFEREETEKEKLSIRTAMENFDALGFSGGAIHIGDKLAAFCYGSALSSDTFCVHIEKADTHYEGIFAAINQQFAEHLPSKFTYIDREDDLGLPGLRYSKESYHPNKMLNKYLAEPMTPEMVEVRRLWLSCFPEDKEEDAEQFLFTKFSSENMLSVKEGGHIISMLHLIPFDDKMYCFAVATDPSHRGKGYASGLFKAAIERCKAKGFTEIVIVPANDNLAKWYQSLGCYKDVLVRFNNSDIADPLCPDGCCLGSGNIATDRALVFPLTSFRHSPGDGIMLL